MDARMRIAAVLAALAAVVATAVPATASADPVPGLPIMVGLGDSWTFGQGATDTATGGYFAVANDTLQDDLDCLPAESEEAADGCKHLQQFNIARPALPGLPGVTTDAVIAEQLPVVLPLLAARNGDDNPRNDVEVVYLSAGGNDISTPIIQACVLVNDPELCQETVAERFGHVAVNMSVILAQLRAAAGPDTPIVLVTYDNPIRYCALGAIPGAADLGDQLVFQLDQIYRAVAANYGVTVATTIGALDAPGDWVGGADCLHPTDSGHAKVAAIAASAAG